MPSLDRTLRRVAPARAETPVVQSGNGWFRPGLRAETAHEAFKDAQRHWPPLMHELYACGRHAQQHARTGNWGDGTRAP